MATYSSDAMRSNMPDMQRIREMEYFQSMYPRRMKALQQYVMEECDSWDYNGSPMYDEFPEQSVIEQASQRILSRLPESMWMEMEESQVMESDIQMQQVEQRPGPGMGRPPQGPPSGRPPQVPPPGRPPQVPPPGRPPQGPPSGRPPQVPPPGRPPQVPPPGRPPQRPPQVPPPGRPPQRPPQGPPPWRPPQMPPPGRPPQRPPQNQPGWLQDIIRLLLLNEFQNRRCRAGMC